MPVYKGSTLVNGVNVRIENVISSGGITPAGTIDISSNGTYDVTEYASANVNVPEKEFTTQTKTATPSTSQQIITPDSGYDGLSQITVEAIPSGSLSTPTISSSGLITAQVGTSGYLASGTKVTKQLTTQAAKTVTPTESEQTVVNSAVYTTGAVKVAAVPTETKTITANGTYTPSSGKYLKQVTVNVPASGIDTSDATATANDIAEGKTAYVNGEKVTGSVNEVTTDGTILASDNMTFETVDSTKYIKIGNITRYVDMLFRKSASLYVRVKAASFGNATAADVAEGKTFTSSAGLRVTGTAKASAPTLQSKTATPSTSQQTITPDNGYDGLSSVTVEAMPTAALSTPTISVDSAGKITAKVEQIASGYVQAGSKSATKQLTTKGAATITPGTSDQTIASGTYLTGTQIIKGDANLVAGNIKSGVSIFGVAGSFEGSGGGGGSGDNNCEAYHITSASAVLSFKGTGTVKVWGYGYQSGGYMGTHYSFVGDGYYSGSYGTPRKTAASFSINADGTLNGLPSGLQAVDLLVTIGV